MPRRIDYHRKQTRDLAAVAFASAAQIAQALGEKCAELASVTRSEVGEHVTGASMVERLQRSADLLRSARGDLLRAIDAVHAIDVTVEEDADRERYSRRW